MILPILLLTFALLAAGVASYGTDPFWISYPHGLEIIYTARRLQFPIYGLCLIFCLALLMLVISGKRRAWWLIGLLPVLALFAHRFETSPMRDFRVVENPPMLAADGSHGVQDGDYVVGLTYGGASYAYPYAMMYRTPVVVQTVVQQRVILLWNPFANMARAFVTDRDLRARELEVVSMPANALLVYNARYGEFINGVTGRTQKNAIPTAFGKPMDVTLTTFGQWKTGHPGTKVVMTCEAASSATSPLKPRYALPTTRQSEAPIDLPVVLLSTAQPTVLLPTDLSDTPANITAGGESVVVFRSGAMGELKAFSRVLPTGEELKFRDGGADTGGNGGAAATIDTLVSGKWSVNGLLMGEPPKDRPDLKGARLAAIPVLEGPYYGILKYWLPGLTAHRVTAEDFVAPPPPPEPPPVPKPVSPRRTTRTPRR